MIPYLVLGGALAAGAFALTSKAKRRRRKHDPRTAATHRMQAIDSRYAVTRRMVKSNPKFEGRKIDLYVDGVYVATSTWSKTLKEAIRNFRNMSMVQTYVPGKGSVAKKVDLTGKKVTAAFADKSNPGVKRRTVIDPITGRRVSVKSARVQMGGSTTRRSLRGWKAMVKGKDGVWRMNPKHHRNPNVLDHIRAGDRITIVTPHGQRRTGRAVMRGPSGWVLNLGGKHGTPGIATNDNIVKISPRK